MNEAIVFFWSTLVVISLLAALGLVGLGHHLIFEEYREGSNKAGIKAISLGFALIAFAAAASFLCPVSL